MIKYLELTPPDDNAFRHAKIVSIDCAEGDRINIGSTLFTVKNGRKKIDLPSTMEGRVVEIIATIGESIGPSTALVLLETEVEGSTASAPISNDEIENLPVGKLITEKTASAKRTKKTSKAAPIKHEQQMLNLLGDDEPVIDTPAPDNRTNHSNEPQKQEALKELPVTKPTPSNSTSDTMPSNSTIQVSVPDIGADSAKVIEILVNVGDSVSAEDPLITLESDKASMDVPSTHAGVIKVINVSLDQDVSEGTVIIDLEISESVEAAAPASAEEPQSVEAEKPAPEQAVKQAAEAPVPQAPKKVDAPTASPSSSHASPSIRRFARELGVDLTQVGGSGRKNRITQEDIKGFVKGIVSGASSNAPTATQGSGIPPIPAQDFSKFGEIDIQPLNKIKRLTASNLHRSWVNVPHVTHNDESNISDLENFRKQLNAEYAKQKKDIKLSPLAFIVKALVNAMQLYPQFNSSLEPGGENLIYKQYFHIGIAVETPNGLVVPVIRDADKKSVAEIATEMGELAKKARDKKLTMTDMSGACITISSLGGIGGTSFTPIVNAPEVAILGVSRSKIQPVWNGSEFEPGMILPLSLSYDHRVIDGAEAARFTRRIAEVLEDVRRLVV